MKFICNENIFMRKDICDLWKVRSHFIMYEGDADFHKEIVGKIHWPYNQVLNDGDLLVYRYEMESRIYRSR